MYSQLAAGAGTIGGTIIGGAIGGPIGASIGGTLGGMGGSALGGMFGGDEADAAKQRQMAAAQEAAGVQTEYLNNAINNRRAGTTQSLGYLQPYEQAGRGGMSLLSDALGINGLDAQRGYFSSFQNDPGFMATQRAGTDAIEQSAAGGGMLRSGGTLKGLMDYGQKGMFAQISDRLNRLTQSGQQGQSAASGMAGINETSNNAISNYMKDIGIARAGGVINSSNADQYGTQNMMTLLANSGGKFQQGANDLSSQFGKLFGAGGWGGGTPLAGGLPIGQGGIGSR